MNATQPQKRLLLKPKEAAAALAISERKLRYMAKGGEIPFVNLGRVTRYDLADLEAWIERKKQRPAAALVIHSA